MKAIKNLFGFVAVVVGCIGFLVSAARGNPATFFACLLIMFFGISIME